MIRCEQRAALNAPSRAQPCLAGTGWRARPWGPHWARALSATWGRLCPKLRFARSRQGAQADTGAPGASMQRGRAARAWARSSGRGGSRSCRNCGLRVASRLRLRKVSRRSTKIRHCFAYVIAPIARTSLLAHARGASPQPVPVRKGSELGDNLEFGMLCRVSGRNFLSRRPSATADVWPLCGLGVSGRSALRAPRRAAGSPARTPQRGSFGVSGRRRPLQARIPMRLGTRC